MSARSLTDEVIAATQREHCTLFPMLKLEFESGTVYLSATDFPVSYDGQVWQAARHIGTIEKITETPDQIEGLRFTLSGVTDEALADAMQVNYQGRRVTVLWCFLDGETLCVDPNAWQGRLDVPQIELGEETATISVTAESRMADWERPRKLMFNHADQRRVDPTDNFFQGIEVIENAEIVIFSKESQML